MTPPRQTLFNNQKVVAAGVRLHKGIIMSYSASTSRNARTRSVAIAGPPPSELAAPLQFRALPTQASPAPSPPRLSCSMTFNRIARTIQHTQDRDIHPVLIRRRAPRTTADSRCQPMFPSSSPIQGQRKQHDHRRQRSLNIKPRSASHPNRRNHKDASPHSSTLAHGSAYAESVLRPETRSPARCSKRPVPYPDCPRPPAPPKAA